MMFHRALPSRLQEFVAGPADPWCCSFRTSRSFPVWFETTEVVDPNDVIDLEAFTQAFNPPLVAIFVHCFPSMGGFPKSWPVAENSSGGSTVKLLFRFHLSWEEMRISPHVADLPLHELAYLPQFQCGGRWHKQGQPLLKKKNWGLPGQVNLSTSLHGIYGFWPRTNSCIWPLCPSFSNQKVFFNSHVFCEELQQKSASQILGILLIMILREFATAFQARDDVV